MRVPVDGSTAWKWVLAVSVSEGAPAGGTGIQYFVGDFDGTRFAVDGAESRRSGLMPGPTFTRHRTGTTCRPIRAERCGSGG